MPIRGAPRMSASTGGEPPWKGAQSSDAYEDDTVDGG